MFAIDTLQPSCLFLIQHIQWCNNPILKIQFTLLLITETLTAQVSPQLISTMAFYFNAQAITTQTLNIWLHHPLSIYQPIGHFHSLHRPQWPLFHQLMQTTTFLFQIALALVLLRPPPQSALHLCLLTLLFRLLIPRFRWYQAQYLLNYKLQYLLRATHLHQTSISHQLLLLLLLPQLLQLAPFLHQKLFQQNQSAPLFAKTQIPSLKSPGNSTKHYIAKSTLKTKRVKSDPIVSACLEPLEKKHQCQICGKYFRRDLPRHLRTHLEITRFECPFPREICPHKQGQFNRPYDFKKHLLHGHFIFDDQKRFEAFATCTKVVLHWHLPLWITVYRRRVVR